MAERLALLTSLHGGVFDRAHAIAAGYSTDEIDRAVARGEWARVRRAAYTSKSLWDQADLASRNVMGLHALTLKLGSSVVGSHETAAAVLGIELWEPTYEWVHLTRPLSAGRREGGVWHHRAALPAADVTAAPPLRITGPLRTALDIARTVDFEHGVVALDSALRLAPASPEALRELHLACADWPGARAAGRAAGFAITGSASVGESRARVQMFLAGLPEPETQVRIFDELGRTVGVVDFLVDGKTVVEFDGRVKYGLDGLAADVMADRLWREKAREDALRRLGYEVVRLVWADLYDPRRIGAVVRAALRRAAVSGPVWGGQSLRPSPESHRSRDSGDPGTRSVPGNRSVLESRAIP